MADVAHLERMGRELKCPICLSLLDSAVSLTCNHVFCNLCIGKSMKLASNCPVCKCPFQRREVRPAPHMDNLVSIYKSMEVVSGVNISGTQTGPLAKLTEVRPAPHMDNLVSIYKSMEVVSGVNISSTQTGPLAKLTGEENKIEGNVVCERNTNEKTCKGISKGKLSKKSLKNNSKANVIKPSFPAKKRVQVPQHPQVETPMRLGKLESENIEQTKDGIRSSLPASKDRTCLDKNGEKIFAPFFWLRNEEEPENITQQTDRDHVSGTPLDAPCFSDIKDSGDEKDCENNTMSALHPVSHIADMFDSEMFEWTQRPCSPEIYSSPMKMQVKQTDKLNGILEMDRQLTVEKDDNTTLERETSEMEVTVPTASSRGANMRNSKGKTIRAKKRTSKASGSTQRKRIKRVTDEVSGIHTNLQIGAGSDMQENFFGNACEPMILKETTCKRNKKVSFNTTSTDSMTVKTCSLYNEQETLTQGGKTVVIDWSKKLDLGQGGKANHQKKLTSKKETSASQCGDMSRRSKSQNLGNGNGILQLPKMSLVLDEETTLPNSCLKTKENVVKNLKAQKCSKKVKISTDDNSKIKGIKSIQSEDEQNSDVRAKDNLSEMEKAPVRPSAMSLRKCDSASNIQCAFCQSTEGSNVSGTMVHYLKGKPVETNYEGGLGIIHAHEECAEWSPNVYFEDETAINLEAELARSRRIKCCCCAVKGASLGCYEKSCHRSFHFPCAKLTPQCRWDNENFVMLCPLHKYIALPSEATGSQLKQKKKCVLKRQSHIPKSQVAISCGINTTSRWSSHGLFKKMVLSCSALSSEDKETVLEFEKLSGVTVLKAWDSCVTHVITSTDENGASKRTLKFLMGILEGKWIVSIEWVKACMKVREPVSEQDYEINSDAHGVRDGPSLGRLRILNKEPKLLSGYNLYFTGDFLPSYKGYLHDLIIVAGGTILHRKPLLLDQEPQSITGSMTPQLLIIYSLEQPDKCSPNKSSLILESRRSDAEALARSTGAMAVSNKWILNSIAACKLQNLTE